MASHDSKSAKLSQVRSQFRGELLFVSEKLVLKGGPDVLADILAGGSDAAKAFVRADGEWKPLDDASGIDVNFHAIRASRRHPVLSAAVSLVSLAALFGLVFALFAQFVLISREHARLAWICGGVFAACIGFTWAVLQPKRLWQLSIGKPKGIEVAQNVAAADNNTIQLLVFWTFWGLWRLIRMLWRAANSGWAPSGYGVETGIVIFESEVKDDAIDVSLFVGTVLRGYVPARVDGIAEGVWESRIQRGQELSRQTIESL